MAKGFMLVLGLLCLVPWSAQAKRSVAVDVPLVLRLELHQVTFLALPEPFASVTSGLPKERLSVGEDGTYISFVVMDPAIPPGRLGIVGESGKLYVIRYEVVPNKSDDEVYITQSAPVKRAPFTVASFVRALRTGAAIPGAQPHAPLLPTSTDARVAVRSVETVTVDGKHGARAIVENTQDEPIQLDVRVGESPQGEQGGQVVLLRQWVWPPRQTLRALAVEQDVIPAHGSTELYLIFEER